MVSFKVARKAFVAKLAQKTWDSDISKYDPMNGGKEELGALTSKEDYDRAAKEYEAKVKHQSAPTTAPTSNHSQTVKQTVALSAPIKEQLDANAPQLKGLVYILDKGGNDIAVAYNADRWTGGTANDFKAYLQKVLPGHRVLSARGDHKPSWTPNY